MRTLKAALAQLEAGATLPGPLQLVNDADVQAPKALDFELNLVSVDEGIEATVVRASGQHVAWLDRVGGRDEFDTSRVWCAMSFELKSCINVPLFQSRIARLCGSGTSSAVAMNGPIGQKVTRDVIW